MTNITEAKGDCSMDELQVFVNQDFGRILAIMKDGEILFVAKDGLVQESV